MANGRECVLQKSKSDRQAITSLDLLHQQQIVQVSTMEDDSRRISVYDLTGLRVHPDGLRVHQTQENLRLGTHRRYNAQVPRGWIANDAGGSVITPKYRKHPQMPSSQDTGDSESLVKAGCEPGQSSEEMVSSTKGKRKDTSNIRKTLKRKKFAEDDSYISSSRMHKNSSGISQLPSQVSHRNLADWDIINAIRTRIC